MIGTLWNTMSNMGNQLISLLVYVLLARLLSVEEFGLIAFSFLILELGNLFVGFGINQNLIQKSEWDDKFAKTCFWFLLGISTLIGATIALIIAPISSYFYEAGSGTVLLFLALVPVLNGVSFVNSAKLEREFKNKKLSAITLTSVTIGGIVSITLALNDFGVWSVIWGRLIQSALNSVLLIAATNFRPALTINKMHISELVNFGLPLMWIALMRFFAEKTMNFAVALVLGNAAFAFVSVAQRGQTTLTSLTIGPLNKMLVPSFSRISDDKVAESYYRVLRASSLIVLPVILGFAAIAELAVQLTFGDKWLISAELISILSFVIIASILGWFLPAIMISRARTHAAFQLAVITLIGNVSAAIAAAFFGIYAIATAVTLVTFITLPMRYRIIQKFVSISFKKSFESVLPSTVAALTMFILIYTSLQHKVIETGLPILDLTLYVAVGGICYLAVLVLLFRGYFFSSLSELKALKRKKKKEKI
tara:strand:+ start:929 stop:2368 length:1440 start_codon:yes stop_codon:yes gene_type:complete